MPRVSTPISRKTTDLDIPEQVDEAEKVEYYLNYHSTNLPAYLTLVTSPVDL